jgi:hypothetical protein
MVRDLACRTAAPRDHAGADAVADGDRLGEGLPANRAFAAVATVVEREGTLRDPAGSATGVAG